MFEIREYPCYYVLIQILKWLSSSARRHSDVISYHLTRLSWMVVVRAWPKWRWPVTFGGGKIIENVWPFFLSVGLALNKPCCLHHSYQPNSTSWESYFAGMFETSKKSMIFFNKLSSMLAVRDFRLRKLKFFHLFKCVIH